MLFLTIIAFLFVLAFSVTIHELGHFLLAKIFHIPVEKFSIGFGPPLYRKKLGETDFRIAYFPLGGYVKMAGEEEGEIAKLIKREEPKELKDEETEAPKDSSATGPGLYEAPIYKRIMVVFSGPFFNIFSAFIIFSLIFIGFGSFVNPYLRIVVQPHTTAAYAGLATGDSIIEVAGRKIRSWEQFEKILSRNDNREITIKVSRENRELTKNLLVKLDSLGLEPMVPAILGSVKIGGPAHKAGMKNRDRILMIDGQEIRTWFELVEKVRSSKNLELEFVWQQNNKIKKAHITPLPFYDPVTKDTVGQIGVLMPLKKESVFGFQAIKLAFNRTTEIIWLTIKTIYQLIKGEISRKALGGPIAIARLSGESARWGFENLLGLLSIISINLGVVNLFPIPALDGGHIVIGLIEALRRKRFSRKTRLLIQQIGYALLLLIIIFVTFNDITR